MTKKKRQAARRSNIGISIDGGKSSATIQRLTALLHSALMAAIAAGREETAKVIAKELAGLGGVNNTTISNCSVQMGRDS